MQDDAPWHGDDSWYGGAERPVVESHLKEIEFKLRESLNRERHALGQLKLEKAYFRRYEAYDDVKGALSKKAAAGKAAVGDEAKQRRDITLYEHEHIALYLSLLRRSVPRHAIDTMTLGVIISVHYALGKRNLNVDELLQGNMSITMWDHMPWDFLNPLVMKVR